jgi:hypothetical protein
MDLPKNTSLQKQKPLDFRFAQVPPGALEQGSCNGLSSKQRVLRILRLRLSLPHRRGQAEATLRGYLAGKSPPSITKSLPRWDIKARYTAEGTVVGLFPDLCHSYKEWRKC